MVHVLEGACKGVTSTSTACLKVHTSFLSSGGNGGWLRTCFGISLWIRKVCCQVFLPIREKTGTGSRQWQVWVRNWVWSDHGTVCCLWETMKVVAWTIERNWTHRINQPIHPFSTCPKIIVHAETTRSPGIVLGKKLQCVVCAKVQVMPIREYSGNSGNGVFLLCEMPWCLMAAPIWWGLVGRCSKWLKQCELCQVLIYLCSSKMGGIEGGSAIL